MTCLYMRGLRTDTRRSQWHACTFWDRVSYLESGLWSGMLYRALFKMTTCLSDQGCLQSGMLDWPPYHCVQTYSSNLPQTTSLGTEDCEASQRCQLQNVTTAESFACDLDDKMQGLPSDQQSIEEQRTAFRDTVHKTALEHLGTTTRRNQDCSMKMTRR